MNHTEYRYCTRRDEPTITRYFTPKISTLADLKTTCTKLATNKATNTHEGFTRAVTAINVLEAYFRKALVNPFIDILCFKKKLYGQPAQKKNCDIVFGNRICYFVLNLM